MTPQQPPKAWIFLIPIGLGLLALPLVADAFTNAHQGSPGLFIRAVQTFIMAQFHLKQALTSSLRAFANTPDLLSLAPLFGSSLLYGALHAAGPGHGKAVATAFMLHGNRKTREGLIFGNLVAFTHGLSGVLTVLCLKWVLETRVSTGLREATRLTSQISFALIMVMGLLLFLNGAYRLWRPAIAPTTAPSPPARLLAAIPFGLVPCPGVVTVMLLAMGLQLTGLGLLMALGITLGMAATISVAVVLVVAGKNRGQRMGILSSPRVGHGLTLISGLLLTLVGLFFLTAHP